MKATVNLRPLVLDDAAKAEVARVKAHAEANHYRPGGSTPGDDPRFVAKLGTYRAVFTYTHDSSDDVYRHLSVSVPSHKYPNPAAVYAIADLFGFTGYDSDKPERPGPWMMDVNRSEHCVVVVEPLK